MTNEGSHRETPFIVGYGPSERFAGEQGAAQVIYSTQKIFFKISWNVLIRTIGLNIYIPPLSICFSFSMP